MVFNLSCKRVSIVVNNHSTAISPEYILNEDKTVHGRSGDIPERGGGRRDSRGREMEIGHSSKVCVRMPTYIKKQILRP